MRIFKYWWIREQWYKVKCFFFPRNAWAKKVIPNEWRDKDWIIEEVLYAAIIDYVEGEKCFQTINWEANDYDKECAVKIKEIYEWAKITRSDMFKLRDAAYPTVDVMGLKNITPEIYDSLYGEVNRIEALIDAKDLEHFTWIVTHRKVLWT